MTSPPDHQTTDPQTIIARLRAELDAALSEKAALSGALAARTAELVTRSNDFDERIAQQSANIDVLRAMSASPSDPQPVFDLIVRSARVLCDGTAAALAEFDGELVHLRSVAGTQVYGDAQNQAYRDLWPMRPNRGSMLCRAILDRQIIHTLDITADPELLPSIRAVGHRSNLAVPLMRNGSAIGALTINAQEPGGFSDPQVALLQTFAEQAVIAITSAETYRTLQTRTGDLKESLEYQTAISDVLNAISRSSFNLKLMLETLLSVAIRLCNADCAMLSQREASGFRVLATQSALAEWAAALEGRLLPVDCGSVTGRAALASKPVQIADAAADPDYSLSGAVTVGNTRTCLGVPLLRDGVVIGAIALARQRVEPFTDRQIGLVSTFADQAVIAIENTRLINEQQEALEQQTATAEVLQVINSSPGNLGPVFDAMLDKAARLSGAAFGMLWGYDGKLFNPVVVHGPSPLVEFYSRHERLLPVPGSGLSRHVSGEDLIQIADIADEALYREGNPRRRAYVELGGARSAVSVALRKDGTLLGAIQVYRQEVRPFSDGQITLLQNFAAQAAIAMENARLITEQREALEQQTATAGVLQVINSSPGNLAPVFDAMLEKAMRLLGAAFGLLYTRDGDNLHLAAERGVPVAFAEWRAKQPLAVRPGSVVHRLYATSRPLHVLNLAAEYERRTDIVGPPAIVKLGGARTLLMVPLLKDATALGHIALYRQETRAFSDKQIALLENFAAQAVIAMENARLLGDLRQRTSDLQESLEYQTATSDVLKVISRSMFDLQPVLAMVAETAARLCLADQAAIFRREGGFARLVSNFGFPPEYEAYAKAMGDFRLDPSSPIVTHRAALEGQPAHVQDVAVVPGYSDLAVRRGKQRTTLGVPLLSQGAVIGVIVLARQRVEPFTDRQIELVSTFADQAVIAIENTRLMTEQREALEQQTATAEVLQVINANPGNLQPVFEAILEKAMRLCEAHFGSFGMWQEDRFSWVTVRGVSPALADYVAQNNVDVGPRAGFARIARSEGYIQFPDIAVSKFYDTGDPFTRLLVDKGGAHTTLTVPLVKNDAVLGLLGFFRQEVRPFTDKQITLLRNFATQAVVAMENARLLNEVRQRQEELRITFENMGDGVAMFDHTPRLVAWNRKFQELLDVPDAILAERRTYAEYIRYLTERGEFGADTDTETQLHRFLEHMREHYAFERTRPDGRVIEIRHNPVPDGGFVLIYADITERKRSEAEIRAARDAAESAFRDLKAAQASLIQAEKMASLGQLTAGIAHEIKNPLNFVNNFADLSAELLDELHDAVAGVRQDEIDELTTTLKGNLAKIAEHGRRADGIVRGMLEHSRGASGDRRVVDLNTLVEEALNLAYHGARAQDQSFNVTLQRDFATGIAPIELTPQDMTRVLLNLFSNGFYATRTRQSDAADSDYEPILKVITRDLGNEVEVRVWDNGTGIPADIKDKLFQPFFTTKPTGEGTDLGLSISYDVVTHQHGGTITVESEPNSFAEFTIRLPRRVANAT